LIGAIALALTLCLGVAIGQNYERETQQQVEQIHGS